MAFIRFHSPLLTESRLISFPLVTKMFQFTKYYKYWFSKRRSTDHWDLQRVEHLPVAFRCMVRPLLFCLGIHPKLFTDSIYDL